MDVILKDFECTDEQVWAMHILVDEEELAIQIINRLEEGEDWSELARTYSTDTSNKDKSGDLGWFSQGTMVSAFEDAAYDLAIGETSVPVETEFGWHIIRKLGQEERPLSDNACQQLRLTKIQEWLDEKREISDVVIDDIWVPNTPVEPNLPSHILQLIMQNQSIQETLTP